MGFDIYATRTAFPRSVHLFHYDAQSYVQAVIVMFAMVSFFIL